jgi:hypothetical protein
MNPARELHDLLKEWQIVPKGSGVLNERTAVPESLAPMNGYARLVRASWYLGEIGRSLDLLESAGENVESYRAFLPAWWNALYLPDTVWNAGVSSASRVVPWDALATLDMYATFLDKTTLQPYPGTGVGFATSKAATTDILKVLRERQDIQDETKQYVFQLLDEVRSLLDAEDLRVSTDLIRRVNELKGWLGVYADYLEEREPGNVVVKKLKRAAKVLLPPSKLLFGAAGYTLGAAADLVQITQGTGTAG